MGRDGAGFELPQGGIKKIPDELYPVFSNNNLRTCSLQNQRFSVMSQRALTRQSKRLVFLSSQLCANGGLHMLFSGEDLFIYFFWIVDDIRLRG